MASKDAEFAEVALRSTSPEALLKAFASLTHQIDSAERTMRTSPPGHESRQQADQKREQRDLVEAEILRRMG